MMTEEKLLEENESITPYRAKLILKAAGDIAERLVSGKYLFDPSYKECEIVLELVTQALEKCKGGKE